MRERRRAGRQAGICGGQQSHIRNPQYQLMEVKSMRWGRDDETKGMTCRPLGAGTIIELLTVDCNRKMSFVSMVKRESPDSAKGTTKVLVTPYSVIDSLLHIDDAGVDYQQEVSKICSCASERYAFKTGRVPQRLKDSKYYDAVRLCEHANDFAKGRDALTEEDARKFIQDYINKDLHKAVNSRK